MLLLPSVSGERVGAPLHPAAILALEDDDDAIFRGSFV
jgi:hypothetical protein